MTNNPTIRLRAAELRRRVESLPGELAAWSARCAKVLDLNAHASQIAAIDFLIMQLVARQRVLLAGLGDDALPFAGGSFALLEEIVKTQRIWGFFRDKLDLRFSPDFKDALWVADAVAWDCHRPVLDRAVDDGILPAGALREPPLCYFTAELSPATWTRQTRPHDGRNYALGTATLPIPVVELPWDYADNLWEFLSLHHEVGHDLEADLGLRQALEGSLDQGLAERPQRKATWKRWVGEVFADLVAIELAGPAFVDALMHLLILPESMVVKLDPADPHPTPYLRVLMNVAYVQRMLPQTPEIAAHAARIEAQWKSVFGPRPGFDGFAGDFDAVFKSLMTTELAPLKAGTVRSLVAFTENDDRAIRYAATWIRTGAAGACVVRPRHALSAARIAVDQIVEAAPGKAPALEGFHERILSLVRANTPGGQRGAEGDRSAFLTSYLDHMSI